MLFAQPFWPIDADMFGRVAETTADRGEFFLFYSYTNVCGCASPTDPAHEPSVAASSHRLGRL